MFTNRSKTHMKRVCVVELWTGQRVAGGWQTGWRGGGWWVAGGWRAGGRRVGGGLPAGGRRVAGGLPVGTSPAGVHGWPCSGRRGRRAPAGGNGRWGRPEPRRSAAPLLLSVDAGCYNQAPPDTKMNTQGLQNQSLS